MRKLTAFFIAVIIPLQGAVQTTDGGSNRVDYGSAASVDGFTANTLVMLVYPNSIHASLNRILASKETSPAAFQKEWGIRTTGQLDATFNTSGTTATARSANSAGNRLTAGKWWFVAFTVSSGMVPKIYLGDLSTPVAEVAYATQTTGTGTMDDDSAGSFLLGNDQALGRSAANRYDAVAYFGTELTLGQLRIIQHRWQNPGGAGFFSLLGATTAPDYSGNANNGTITGATAVDPAPRGPWFGLNLFDLTRRVLGIYA